MHCSPVATAGCLRGQWAGHRAGLHGAEDGRVAGGNGCGQRSELEIRGAGALGGDCDCAVK